MPNDHGYAFAQGQFDFQEGPDPFEDDTEIEESEINKNDTI